MISVQNNLVSMLILMSLTRARVTKQLEITDRQIATKQHNMIRRQDIVNQKKPKGNEIKWKDPRAITYEGEYISCIHVVPVDPSRTLTFTNAFVGTDWFFVQTKTTVRYIGRQEPIPEPTGFVSVKEFPLFELYAFMDGQHCGSSGYNTPAEDVVSAANRRGATMKHYYDIKYVAKTGIESIPFAVVFADRNPVFLNCRPNTDFAPHARTFTEHLHTVALDNINTVDSVTMKIDPRF